jgi:hypothetical protein
VEFHRDQLAVVVEPHRRAVSIPPEKTHQADKPFRPGRNDAFIKAPVRKIPHRHGSDGRVFEDEVTDVVNELFFHRSRRDKGRLGGGEAGRHDPYDEKPSRKKSRT